MRGRKHAFLLKREASLTVRASKTAAGHGSKERPDETMDGRVVVPEYS
jgi:hypothetical protein